MTINLAATKAEMLAFDHLPEKIRAALRDKQENLSALYAAACLQAGFTEEQILDKLRRMV